MIQITATIKIPMIEKLSKEDPYNNTIRDVAKEAEKYAKQMCPVDTGRLKKSIYLSLEKSGFQLGASAPYAIFNEYGSITTPIGSVGSPIAAKKAGVRPFLRPAMHRAIRNASKYFSQNIRKG